MKTRFVFPSEENSLGFEPSPFKSKRITYQSGKLIRKSAASERAWFLKEESELRT
jgi:hypothetical protein